MPTQDKPITEEQLLDEDLAQFQAFCERIRTLAPRSDVEALWNFMLTRKWSVTKCSAALAQVLASIIGSTSDSEAQVTSLVDSFANFINMGAEMAFEETQRKKAARG